LGMVRQFFVTVNKPLGHQLMALLVFVYL